MKLKICGQKHNVKAVAALQPDYLGFIFWKPSPRYFDGAFPLLESNIKKVGVFVDAEPEEVIAKAGRYDLDAVQLHGQESSAYCQALRDDLHIISDEKTPSEDLDTNRKVEIIKVFSIRDTFDFSVLEAYEKVCDYYLFDTKGKLPGGNGYAFNWEVLKDYPSVKPYFLSGGIGLENVDSLLSFLNRPESKYCYAIDVNSTFEIQPGLKDIHQIKEFKKLLEHELSR